MRPLQLCLLSQWSMSTQPLSFRVFLNSKFQEHLLWWTDIHNIRQGKILHLPTETETLCTDSSRMGWHPSTQFTWSTRSGIRPYPKEHQLAGNQSHLTSHRSLPSDVGPQIGDDPHRQHSVPIQLEEGGRNSFSGAVLHSLGHSHEMSEPPDPPSCPTSDGDDERSGGKVEQSEQSHSHRVVYRQQRLPSHYQTTRRTQRRPLCHMSQQEAASVRQPLSRSTSCSNRHAEHGLEQSPLGLRIPSDANSPQVASEDQDVFSHLHSDCASLADSILVPGSPQSIHSNSVHDSSALLYQVVGRQTWFHRNTGMYHYHAWTLSTIRSQIEDFQTGLPKEFRNLNGTLPDWSMRESGQSSVLGAVGGRVIHSLPLSL